jgi:hypothetical protein
MSTTSEMIAELRTLGKALAEETEKLNAALVEAGDAFVGLGLGVSARVPLDVHHNLVLMKHDGRWKLLAERNGNGVPIERAPREIRILAASRLDALLGALFDAAETALRNVIHHAHATRAFADDVRKMKDQ